jgi:outer membrane lipase/esterase
MRNVGYLMIAVGALLLAGTAKVQAQVPYFGQYYGFGDSLTDNGRVFRETGYNPSAVVGSLFSGAPGIYENGQWSNLPGFFNLVPAKLGIASNPQNDFAVGGAQSVHQAPFALLSPTFSWGLPDQIDTFAARVGRFAPNDLINVWIGYNDLTGIPVAASQASKLAAVQGIITNTTDAISRLASFGGRQFVVFNQETFRPSNADSAATMNALLPSALAPLSASGLNIHYFDLDQLASRLRANPTAYGFAPNAGTVACSQVPACALNGFSTGLENQYISPEGIHFTGAVNGIIANFLANQLNAPFTMVVQADMAQSAGVSFVNSLQARLDAYHFAGAAGSPSNAYAMYTKAPPRQSPDPYGPWSIFAMGSYVHASERNQVGVPNHDNDIGAGTVGFEYRWSRNLLLGGAFSYSDTTVNLSLGDTHTQLKLYQFAGFASTNYGNWFGDLVVSYGINDYSISRASAGIGSIGNTITASPSGNNFVAASKAGYLFDTGVVRVGPIAGLTYSRVWIDPYAEIGDPLLTQAVSKQNLDGWTASAGVQLRLPATNVPRTFNPFFNLTAEQDFGGNARVITTAQTYALGLPIATQLGSGRSQTYGKAAAGATIDLGGRFSGNINAESTFARENGNVIAVTAGITARL